ncbi:MAG: nitroreductase family protein [Clostridia bacterium]|nr:nitroreductase family protein [Clostridia bacterium]
MEFIDLIKRNRSYRNFDESAKLSRETVLSFIECARLSASAANAQPLKYYVSTDADTNALIQKETAWAAKLRPQRMLPDAGHNPTAFIVICVDTTIQKQPANADRDIGIAAQSILLSAVSQGYGGLMIGAFNRQNTKQALRLAENMEPALVIALGKPAEVVVLEDSDGSIDYYRDENDVHHVPKRRMEEIIINE